MAAPVLIKPTLHIEVQLTSTVTPEMHKTVRAEVPEWLHGNYVSVQVGQLSDHDTMKHSKIIRAISVADFTGPTNTTGFYNIEGTALDVQTYFLRPENDTSDRRSIKQVDEVPQARMLALPNLTLDHEWDSLVFEDGLPARLLRYLVRMIAMMGQAGLKLSTFNWNRLCLLHGPPGSGKSTLCRALAQKLSIRLGDRFVSSVLVEVKANAMLSKYFGESGKLIESTFESVRTLARDRQKLVVVVIDEVETIAGSRRAASNNGECNDGLRATNQLLTALDRLRNLANVIVCCTSNLIEAIDPAFLDRVDIKQHVPCPSPSAIYNIFRSCLNELVRSSLVDTNSTPVSAKTPSQTPALSSSSPYVVVPSKAIPSPPSKKRRITTRITKPLPKSSSPPPSSSSIPNSSSPEPFTLIGALEIPSLATTRTTLFDQPTAPGYRVWTLAKRCLGLSGRTLRRLPILGLAMYTWGGTQTLDDAVTALERAVEQELLTKSAEART